MNEDETAILQDLIRSRGWELTKSLVKESVENWRRMATQQKVALEDRLWFSAFAQGQEETIDYIEQHAKVEN